MIMNIDLAGITLVAAGFLLLPFFGLATLVAVVVLLRMDYTRSADEARRSFWRSCVASSFALGIVCVLLLYWVADQHFSHSARNTLDETWWLWGPVPLVVYVSLVLRARRRYHRTRLQPAPAGAEQG